MLRSLRPWILLACAAFLLMPWYAVEARGGAFASLVVSLVDPTHSGLVQLVSGRWWLWPVPLALILGLLAAFAPGLPRERRVTLTLIAGVGGLALFCLQAFLIGMNGFKLDMLTAALGQGPVQAGLGFGGALVGLSLLMIMSAGLAGRGVCRGDVFVVASVALLVALVSLFVFYPIAIMLASAFEGEGGQGSFAAFVGKLSDRSIWGLDCLYGELRCGVAWNTLILAVVVGVASTLLGLAFALIALRSGFPAKRTLRVLTVLPIITPPFVIGLALILMFGRSGAISGLMWEWFGIPRSRWIYGLPGVAIAQVLAFAPLAFLVLIGVVQGVSPSLEEAAQTLRAKPFTIFRTVTLPLIRPGLANAFLLCFVESMADFGNPLVLGGNFEVLSTKIFFAVVGAAHDQARAAVLSIVLLSLTLLGFWAQQRWVGRKTYTTVAGKGDGGLPLPLPKGVAIACYAVALPWALFTAVTYVLILFGGFVRSLGRDYTFTLDHFITGFRIEQTQHGLFFSGSAWNSFFATVEIAALAAPLTAGLGLLAGYLLTRQRFSGQRAFEFMTLLSFAIPGTVVGVSYILAFNVPPVEITGTAFVLVMCFVFRNMPVGVRAGIATMSQIDKSLDEASLTLGARSFTTVRRVILPLLRPAIVASLVYSFVRAMTAVSAVIFLVTAEWNMATTYIVGRVEAGEFGLAIAYSSVLIVVMLAAIGLIELLVGERRLGRRAAQAPAAAPIPAAAA